MDTRFRLFAASVLALGFSAAHAALAPLNARFAELRPSLASNAFGRPLHLESRESDSALKGEVYALVNHPFEEVRDALKSSTSWCEVMLLPFNTKGCTAEPSALHVHIGRKKDTTLAEAYKVDFRYQLRSSDADYLDVALDAPSGPLGTHDYRIALEATPVEGGRTFIHLSYSYAFGAMSRLAMSTYLATAGADKVGFSKDAAGKYVGGVRGVIERNTMRYFLAIEAYLDSLAIPRDARVEKRLRAWYTASERYPRQLHEIDYDEYVAMKKREYARLAAS